jgi:hypothetical protein
LATQALVKWLSSLSDVNHHLPATQVMEETTWAAGIIARHQLLSLNLKCARLTVTVALEAWFSLVKPMAEVRLGPTTEEATRRPCTN